MSSRTNRWVDAGVKFYASLGNHDDPHEERLYKPFNMGGERYYTFQKGDASFFVLDSKAIFIMRCIRMGSITGPIWFCGGRKCCRFSNGMRVNAVFSGHEHVYERLKPEDGIHFFILGNAAMRMTHGFRSQQDMEVGVDGTRIHDRGNRRRYLVLSISRTGQTTDSGTVARQ